MSEWYVSSIAGNNANDGYGSTDRTDPTQSDNWSNSFENLITAFGSAGDDDIIYVASGHSYANAGADYNGGGALGSGVTVVSVNTTTGAYTPGAEETFTSAFFFSASQKEVLFLGVFFESSYIIYFDTYSNISIIDGGLSCTVSNRNIAIGEGCFARIENSTITANGNTNLFEISLGGTLEIDGGSLAGTVPTSFIKSVYRGGNAVIKNFDLSLITGAGKYYLDGPDIASEMAGNFLFKRCKIGSSPALLTASDILRPETTVILRSCDTADDTEFFQEKTHCGQVFKDTANYLTSDHSVKMVTNAYAKEFVKPLRYALLSLPLSANPTILINTMTDSITLDDDEFWIEVEYPDETDEVLGKTASSRATNFISPTALDTNSESWTDDSLSSPVYQEAEVTIIDGAAGIHTVYACFAKPSSTVFVERIPTVS